MICRAQTRHARTQAGPEVVAMLRNLANQDRRAGGSTTRGLVAEHGQCQVGLHRTTLRGLTVPGQLVLAYWCLHALPELLLYFSRFCPVWLCSVATVRQACVWGTLPCSKTGSWTPGATRSTRAYLCKLGGHSARMGLPNYRRALSFPSV